MIEIDKEQQALRNRIKTDRKFHDDLLRLVNQRKEYSERHMNQRYDAWRKAESQHLAYVDLTEHDKAGKQTYRNPKDIVIPYTFAIIQTRLTYFFFALASKNPMVPISGRGPQDNMAAKIMEIIQDYQTSETKALAVNYCFFQDAERYGCGIIKNVFYDETEKRWIAKRTPVKFMGFTLFDRFTRTREDVITYEGNLPTNVSPFNFLPDPRVNISDVRNMEFCGDKAKESYNSCLTKEQNGEYFNVDKINMGANRNQSTRPFDSSEQYNNESNLPRIVGVESSPGFIGDPNNQITKDAQNLDRVEMVIRLIPNDHDISNSIYPEEWFFTVMNGETIVKCEPNIYSSFNYFVGESNHDYASPMNVSSVDMYNGLADTLTWLFNSHMANVRKIVNDSVIVDPSMIELADLLSDKPVKIVRLKEAYWGRQNAVDSAVKQLQISDITRGHIADSQVVMNLIQRASAATDNIMGVPEEVKRTATETSSTTNLATARLKLTLYLYYILAIRPLYKQQVFNNQALMTEERYYRITDDVALQLGQDPEQLKGRILVSPDQLYGNFDFDIPPLDMPIDKATMAKVWREIIQDVSNNPMLANRFDIFPMFRQMVYNMGVTNPNDFLVKTQVRPDEAVMQQAQAGNLAPINQVAPVSNGQMQEAMGRMQ